VGGQTPHEVILNGREAEVWAAKAQGYYDMGTLRGGRLHGGLEGGCRDWKGKNQKKSL